MITVEHICKTYRVARRNSGLWTVPLKSCPAAFAGTTDAVSKIAVRNIIREINRDHGTTIILTTHDTQDIEALTNRILLIGKGRLLLDGDLQMLKKHYSSAKHISIDYTPFPRGGSVSDLTNIQEYPLSRIFPAGWRSWQTRPPSACPMLSPSSIPGWKSTTCQSQAPPWMKWWFPFIRSFQYEKIRFLFQNPFHPGNRSSCVFPLSCPPFP